MSFQPREERAIRHHLNHNPHLRLTLQSQPGQVLFLDRRGVRLVKVPMADLLETYDADRSRALRYVLYVLIVGLVLLLVMGFFDTAKSSSTGYQAAIDALALRYHYDPTLKGSGELQPADAVVQRADGRVQQ